MLPNLPSHPDLRKIVVLNPKGGSGKTTIPSSLASYFASKSVAVTVMDYDPQGSSLNWLRLRDSFRNRIYAANAAPQRGKRLRGIETPDRLGLQ